MKLKTFSAAAAAALLMAGAASDAALAQAGTTLECPAQIAMTPNLQSPWAMISRQRGPQVNFTATHALLTDSRQFICQYGSEQMMVVAVGKSCDAENRAHWQGDLQTQSAISCTIAVPGVAPVPANCRVVCDP